MSKFTADSIPDQSGRVVLCTGANSGIGFEFARQLARHGAQVVLACRNSERGSAARDKIASEFPSASVVSMTLDLSSLASVKAFAYQFLQKFNRLDILCNNAGIMLTPKELSADGVELQFATNHLGHFALTAHLYALLQQTDGSRIVNVSSIAHRHGNVDFDNLRSEKSYNRMAAYGRSKLCNLLFTFELCRRIEAAGDRVVSVAAHPGYASTQLMQGPAQGRGQFAKFFVDQVCKFMNFAMAQTAAAGALPLLRAATAGDVKPGEYYGPGGWMEMRGAPVRVQSTDASHDPHVAKNLWTVSEDLAGVKFLS